MEFKWQQTIDSMWDTQTPVTQVLDDFVSFKLVRYRRRFDMMMTKLRGEEEWALNEMGDLDIQSNFLIQSIQWKFWNMSYQKLDGVFLQLYPYWRSKLQDSRGVWPWSKRS